jgi:hypothetical protein
MTHKAAPQSHLVPQQLEEQLHHLQEHQQDLATHLTDGLSHQLVVAKSHFPTPIIKPLTSNSMLNGVLAQVQIRLLFLLSHLKATEQF